MKPSLDARYDATASLPCLSRWFVGSSIRGYIPSPAKRYASISFVLSPPDRVSCGRHMMSGSVPIRLSSFRTFQSSASGSTSIGNSITGGTPVIVPPWSSSPFKSLKKVVLPLPLRPARASFHEVSMVTLTPSKSILSDPSYPKVRSLIVIIGIKIPPENESSPDKFSQ